MLGRWLRAAGSPKYLRKVILAACAAAVIVTGGLTAFIVIRERTATIEHATIRQAETVSMFAAQTTRAFEAVDVLLNAIAFRIEQRGSVAAALQPEWLAMLQGELARLPHVRAITLVDHNGTVRHVIASADSAAPGDASTPTHRVGDSVSDHPYFTYHREQPDLALRVARSTVGGGQGSHLLVASRRVGRTAERFVGAAMVSIDPAFFAAIGETLALGDLGSLVVFSDDGDMIGRYPSARPLIGRSFADRPLFRTYLPRAQSGSYITPGDDRRGGRLATYQRVDGLPIVLSMSRGLNLILEPWRRFAITAGIALAMLLAVVALTTLAMLHMVRQIDAAEALAREARDAAERANRAKSSFLANMSHELRTPLNAVLGFSEIIETQMFGPVGHAKYGEYATLIRSSGQHLLAVVNNILDLAKVESGKWVLHREAVDLDLQIAEVVEILRNVAEKAGVALIEAVPTPVIADADPVVLRQMLINVAGNAIKFTPPGGSVTLSAEDGGTHCIIAIRDTGIGIKAADLERVMAPFEQAEIGAARRHKDTGLGLPLTKALAELHGGTFALASTPGVGTTVTITLPKAGAEAAPLPAAPPHQAAA